MLWNIFWPKLWSAVSADNNFAYSAAVTGSVSGGILLLMATVVTISVTTVIFFFCV